MSRENKIKLISYYIYRADVRPHAHWCWMKAKTLSVVYQADLAQASGEGALNGSTDRRWGDGPCEFTQRIERMRAESRAGFRCTRHRAGRGASNPPDRPCPAHPRGHHRRCSGLDRVGGAGRVCNCSATGFARRTDG